MEIYNPSIQYGYVEVDFGSAPGNNYVETILTAPGIETATNITVSKISTPTVDHSTQEHLIIPFEFSTHTTGTTATLYVYSQFRLTGKFNFMYTYTQ